MRPFKKLDNYLLHQYPSIWVTRIHLFVPLGLGIALILFMIPVFSGWTLKDELPRNYELPIFLMIIPVLIYLVYWFIFQSRYNVLKSGGNMPNSYEYLNFFSYMLVFFTALCIVMAIPFGNIQKVRNAIDEEDFKQDIISLNFGNTLVNGNPTFDSTGNVTFTTSYFHYDSYYVRYNADYWDSKSKTVTVTYHEAEKIIADYLTAYNKYTVDTIYKTAAEVLTKSKKTYEIRKSFELEYDTHPAPREITQKLKWITRGFEQGWHKEFRDGVAWRALLGIMGYLSLLIWIFKQMHLRQFIFGFIAISLTPLFAAIIGVILFGLLDIRSNEVKTISGIVLLFYLFFAALVIQSFRATTLNKTDYVITMYLQFFLPLLPLFLWMFFLYDSTRYIYYKREVFDYLYWFSWIIGLISIVVFKPLYAKFRSLPSRN